MEYMLKIDIILNLIDGFFALMAIPTMLSTIILAPRVMKEAFYIALEKALHNFLKAKLQVET